MALARPGAIIENLAWHHHEQAFDLYPRTVARIAAGAISNAKLVTHAGPVAKAAEIYRAGAEKSGGYIKGVITF